MHKPVIDGKKNKLLNSSDDPKNAHACHYHLPQSCRVQFLVKIKTQESNKKKNVNK
jgi:hypothetical protein